MSIYRFERLIAIIPAYSTIFIVVVTYIKALKKKVSLFNWLKFGLIILCLFLILAFLRDGLLVNCSDIYQMILSAPVYLLFNLLLVNWQEKYL